MGRTGLPDGKPSLHEVFLRESDHVHPSNQEARDLIRSFMGLYFRDKNKLVYPKNPVESTIPDEVVKALFSGQSYTDDYKILSKKVRELGENIPPLINAYMNLSPSMKSFGTAVKIGRAHV